MEQKKTIQTTNTVCKWSYQYIIKSCNHDKLKENMSNTDQFRTVQTAAESVV